MATSRDAFDMNFVLDQLLDTASAPLPVIPNQNFQAQDVGITGSTTPFQTTNQNIRDNSTTMQNFQYHFMQNSASMGYAEIMEKEFQDIYEVPSLTKYETTSDVVPMEVINITKKHIEMLKMKYVKLEADYNILCEETKETAMEEAKINKKIEKIEQTTEVWTKMVEDMQVKVEKKKLACQAPERELDDYQRQALNMESEIEQIKEEAKKHKSAKNNKMARHLYKKRKNHEKHLAAFLDMIKDRKKIENDWRISMEKYCKCHNGSAPSTMD